MQVKELLKSIYIQLGNITEQELDTLIALEMLKQSFAEMRIEEILGYRNEIIKKTEFNMPPSGKLTHSLEDFFAEIVLCLFRKNPILEVSVASLPDYRKECTQAVAFYVNDKVQFVELAIPEQGKLEVIYEPSQNLWQEIEDRKLADLYVQSLVVRTSQKCLKYVRYDDPHREAMRSFLYQDLTQSANQMRDFWKERVNRFSNGLRPIVRRPFRAIK